MLMAYITNDMVYILFEGSGLKPVKL